jgi:WD40-like Beta Propeller Repeat
MNLRDDFLWVHVRSLARRSAQAWRAALCAGLFGASLLVACGGGGGDGGSTGGSGPVPGTLAGAWYYDGAGTAQRFELATAAETSVALNPKSTAQIGYGGGRFTDVDEDTSVFPFEFTVNLRRPTAPYLEKTGQLPVFSVQGGAVRGPVQPAPNGSLYAVQTHESAALSEPFFDYLYVLDATLAVPLRVKGVRNPAWLDNTHVVVAGDDGLFSVVAAAGAALVRLGPVGLGLPGSAPAMPSVSPDGRSIAFVQGDAIWRIGVDGTGLTRLTQPLVSQAWPAWSPDGSQLVVIYGPCGPVGGGPPPPDAVVISASASDQNIRDASKPTRKNGAPVRTCGPLTWLAQ